MSEVFEAPQSRIEAILQNILGADNEILPPFSRNEVLLIEIAGLISGKQDKLVSGENIKTVNGHDILGAGDLKLGKWKLLTHYEQAESSTSMNIELPEGFFANQSYTKYKVALKIVPNSEYDATGIPIRFYFRNNGNNALGYRLLYTSSNSVYRSSAAQNFNAEFYIIKNTQNPDVVSTILMPSGYNGSFGSSIIGSGNNGTFDNTTTPQGIRYLYIDAMNQSGFSFDEGTEVWVYACEED